MPDNVNPMASLYKHLNTLVTQVEIKYNYLAESMETMESKQLADEYLDALQGIDTFDSYISWSRAELNAAGLYDVNLVEKCLVTPSFVPEQYRSILLKNRRSYIKQNYKEQNNYYRKLNGYPDLEDKKSYYIPDDYCTSYGIETNVPIHRLQDYYNNIESGRGDYLIGIIENLGVIDDLKKAHPEKEYLSYIGSKRISIETARSAKNFAIIHAEQGNIASSIYTMFLQCYEQCREYFMTVIFVSRLRSVIDYYDNFIALCIMVMTQLQVIMKQLPLGIRREFYDPQSIRMLYESYGVPYNMDVDDQTQRSIAQNLNLLIQNKSTNKVIYDIAELLGFDSVKVYKYYLVKNRKLDAYGVPIFKSTERFNNDTGMVETLPDYESMYDVYFQKVELNDNDVENAFDDVLNRVEYDSIVTKDPYWIEDSNVYNEIWETEYNYVESKYLGLNISYNMTDIMLNNTTLIKALIENEKAFGTIHVEISKIVNDLEISVLDAVVLLCCLTAKSHYLKGEIISIPTQILDVEDYMKNTDSGDDMLVDSFGFNFRFFLPGNPENQTLIHDVLNLLGEEDAKKIRQYISVVAIDPDASNAEKIQAINDLISNVSSLHTYISYLMPKTTDRKLYNVLRQFYRAVFYTREVKSMFTINKGTSGERTASSFFEFLYYHNPTVYNAIFTRDIESQYKYYLFNHSDEITRLSLEDYEKKVFDGEIDINWDTLISEVDDSAGAITREQLYYYINHVTNELESSISSGSIGIISEDSESPLEKLLIALIRHFKSYTVDMIGLDTIFVSNLKLDNSFKLFDEVNYIRKTDQIDERIKTAYSDVVHSISAKLKLLGNDDKTGILSDSNNLIARHHVNDTIGIRDGVVKTYYKDATD